MGDLINLAHYRRAKKTQEPPEPDEIVLRLKPDGTCHVTVSGAYLAALPLAIEHLADAIRTISQAI